MQDKHKDENFELLKEAVEEEDVAAQFNLGVCSKKGRGVEKGHEQGVCVERPLNKDYPWVGTILVQFRLL